MDIGQMKATNWLILGGGAVVTEYYLPAFEYLQCLDRVTVVDPDAASLARIPARWPITRIQMDYRQFLADSALRPAGCMAIIALPNFLHADAASRCMAAGIAALCEKPLALHSHEITALIQQAGATAVPLVVGMVRRYLPTFATLKRMLASGRFGRVLSVDVSYGGPFGWVADSPAFFDPRNGGVLADMGIHYLDLLVHLFGELKPVSCDDDYAGGVEANVTMQLAAGADSIPILLELSRTTRLANVFRITTADAVISVYSDSFDHVEVRTGDSVYRVTPAIPFSCAADLPAVFTAAFVEQLWQFFRHAKGDATAQITTPAAALQGVALVEWAYARRQPPVFDAAGDSRFYITGGTGFIGSELIRHVCTHNLGTVTAPVHRYRGCAPIAVWPVALPRLNLFDEDALVRQIQGHRYVVHLAYDNAGVDDFRINVDGTRCLLQAAVRAGVEAVVVLSSMYVYGHPASDVPLDENAPMQPAGGNYGKSKAQMQQWCLDFARTMQGTRLVVLNPGCVYGPGGKTYTTLPLDLAINRRFCWIDNGCGTANVVYIDNLIDAIMLALTTPAAHGRNYLIVDQAMTWRDFLTPLLPGYAAALESQSVRELRDPVIADPVTLKQIIVHLANNYDFLALVNRNRLLRMLKTTAFRLSGHVRKNLIAEREQVAAAGSLPRPAQPTPNYPAWLADLFGPTVTRFSSERAATELGWRPRVTPQQAMARTVDWLQQHTRHWRKGT